MKLKKVLCLTMAGVMAFGLVACGDSGKGKLPDIEDIIDKAEELLHTDKPLYGQQVLITAGPTQEALDPVRFLTKQLIQKLLQIQKLRLQS